MLILYTHKVIRVINYHEISYKFVINKMLLL